MLKQTVLDHFKTPSNVARALDISPAAVTKWGAVVPYFSAVEIERVTGGALKVCADMYERGRPVRIDRLVVNH